MTKKKILARLLLLGGSVVVGIRMGIKYGWLSGHSHWSIEKLKSRRSEDFVDSLRKKGY